MTQSRAFSRWGLIFAAIGMAVGTGNLWRFPRVLAANGGGAFLIPWAIFLFLWSIPLLIIEFSMGRHARKGPALAFAHLLGPRFGWMGGFVGLCTMLIMFYYAVVAGWCLRYFSNAVYQIWQGASITQPGEVVWNQFMNSKFQPLLFLVLAIIISSLILKRGIVTGVEKANKIMLPGLIILLVLAVARAVTLPGAIEGLNYLFSPRWELLLGHKIWLEALSQSAWSTGAGWGLLLTYAIYSRKEEDIVLNSFITGFGNNSASLLGSLAIFPAVFALSPLLGLDPGMKLAESGPASTGLTFIWLPQLFSQAPLGDVLTALFFLVLSFAAISSLISMFALSIQLLTDWGVPLKKARVWLPVFAFVLGAPSAVNLKFFENQDWVWGVGLIISGAFFAFAVIRFGVSRFRLEIISKATNDLQLGAWFDVIVRFIIPIEFVALVGWWFYQASRWETQWWHPFKGFSIGTCVFQWGLLIGALVVANRLILNHRLQTREENG